MSFGAQSMVDRLRRVLLVPPPARLRPDVCAACGWTSVDAEGLAQQYAQFATLLEGLGVEVLEGAQAPDQNPDAIYAYDGVLVTRAGVVTLRPGKANRSDEPAQRAADLGALGIPLYGRVEAPGTVDGGDVLWLREDLAVVGLGWRTNRSGAEQLRQLLEPLGVRVETVDLPNYRGPEHCLHLMSLISQVSESLAVVAEAMLPVRLIRLLDSMGVRRIPSPESEFESLGTNVLALGDGQVVALASNPRTNEHMRAHDLRVHVFDGSELCLPGTGGPTCLTRPLWRQR